MQSGPDEPESFDVIIVGGSYAGLSVAMSLGRALRRTLVIDAGDPCNRQTPHSHNFLTQDGNTPAEIAALAREQVQRYDTVNFISATAVSAQKIQGRYSVRLADGQTLESRKLLLATGVRDMLPDIPGLAECWGISVLHCPYCHGYEVRDTPIGLLANGADGLHLARLLHNWSESLTLFTNGTSTLDAGDAALLASHGITIDERKIARLEHHNGMLQSIIFNDGSRQEINSIFARVPTQQKSGLAVELGCDLNDNGLINVDEMQRTSVPGVFAAGDNCWALRSVANAIGAGSKAGAFINHEMINEDF
ncbi:NAD(P)/FAD-dependent oxidoreductase [bacterium]|nr:NAD(P)/FAD-dependent oxidoreductase [bacterium]